MRPLAGRCVAVPVLLAIAAYFGPPVWASAFSVAGTVRNASGSGIADAVIDLRDAGQGVVVATTSTDSAGGYAIWAVDAGVYDVTVTPPQGSGFQPTTVRSFVVDGDETLNVVLVDSGSTSTFSGVVRGRGGTPLPSVQVMLSGPSGGGGSSTSGADGGFSVVVSPPGRYALSVRRGNDRTVDLPYLFRVGGEEVDLSQGSVVADVTLPLVYSEVEVLGPDGAPVTGVRVETTLVEPDLVDLVPGGGTSAVAGPPSFVDVNDTGPDGVARQVLFAAQSATLTVTPPVDSGLAQKTVTGIPVTDAGHVVVTLDRPVSLSGVVRGRGGTPLPGVRVGLSNFTGTSDADGVFTVLASPPGTYPLTVTRGTNDRTLPLPSVFRIGGENVDLSQGSVVADVTLPLLDSEVEVRGPYGTPVVGANVETRLVDPKPVDLIPGGATSTVTSPPDFRDDRETGPDGVVHLVLLPARSATVTVTPRGDSGLAGKVVTDVPVIDGGHIIVTLDQPVSLSGVVRGHGGVPLQGVRVSLSGASGGGGDTSRADGTFSAVVSPPGVYTLTVTRGSNEQRLPLAFQVGGEEVDLSHGSVFADVTLPLVDSEVEVLGPDGGPVVGSMVTARLVEADPVDLIVGGPMSAVVSPPGLIDGSETGPDGVAHLLLLTARSATITVTAPAGSGLLEQTVTDAPVADGGRTVISLQRQVRLTSISIAPASVTVPKGIARQFTATGSYSDGSIADLTSTATWASSELAVATVGATGRAATIGVGTASITATVGSVSGAGTLTVTVPELVSVAVSPDRVSAPKGTARQFTAIGTYTDSSTADLTSSAAWSSANTTIATVDASGHATALVLGTTTIVARIGSLLGTAELTVTKIPTAMTASSARRQSLGVVERITFTVRLTSAVDDGPLVGETVTITAPNGRTCSATTDSNGVAICRINYVRTNFPPRGSTYAGSFAGSADYQTATAIGLIP